MHRDSGPAALEYLIDPSAELPGLILMDIRMPGLDGHETLARIRGSRDRSVATLPVVMLTTSDDEVDVRRAYSLYANSYFVKPVDARSFRNVVIKLDEYWGQIVRRPRSQ